MNSKFLLCIMLFTIGAAMQLAIPEQEQAMFIRHIAYCPNGWVSYADSCYRFVHNRRTWLQAQMACHADGANLVTLETYHEITWLRAHLYHRTPWAMWIGGVKDQHGTWRWARGTSLDWPPITVRGWIDGEPNNRGWLLQTAVEYCIATWTSDRKWNDAPCDYEFEFICEKSKDH